MAMILDAFMGKFNELLVGYIEEEAVMLLGVKDELRKLQRQMVWIQNLLEDAEKRKFDNLAINQWLSELKDAMYDADDIIDLCRIEGAQLLAEKPSKQKNPPVYCNFPCLSCFTSIPLRHEIGLRIKELNDKLKQIYESRKMYELENTKPATQITQVDARRTSPMADFVVVGREIEEATTNLVKFLSDGQGGKCRLVAITGMGGVGKTTLAQKIYNHPIIQKEFMLKIWVCISQSYSETGLLQLVIREAEGRYGDAITKSELQPKLKSAISGKTLFLVLDDVWRADVWLDLFRIPLQSSDTNVRILVTTRDANVVGKIKPAYIHHVKQLSKETGWEMLYRSLFSEGEEEEISSWSEIGFQIVDRCEGLPLAIKAIAGVLTGKERTKKEWEKVLRNDAWSMSKLPEELRGPLYLSYDDLPSHLKQCFLFCSLYPEDATISRRDLMRLWVAEGFVKEQQNSTTDDTLLEDIAKEYYEELLRRNLLQKDPSNLTASTCKMHDLFRSLAQFLSKDESFCGIATSQYKPTSTKLRRLSLVDQETATGILDSLKDQRFIRTLLAAYVPLTLDDNQLDRFSHLRVLEINSPAIRNISTAIGDLVHLRYLNLDRTNIKELPESIKRLTNLQFLNLRACMCLTALPAGITKLLNLRRLGLYNTPLNFIPKGIGNLQQLNDLSGFVVANMDIIPSQTSEPQSSTSSSTLEELNFLKQLRMLSICSLERAQIGSVILKELPHLLDLKLFCNSDGEYMEEDINRLEKLFNELIPPRRLEELKIKGFFGSVYPSWMSSSSFSEFLPSLTSMELVDITSCTQLPPFGELPELRFLLIKGMFAVKKIGPEFLGGGVRATTRTAFPKLEVLKIHEMHFLEEWSFGDEMEEFDANGEKNSSPRIKILPRLHQISIRDCQLLKQLPKGLKHCTMKTLYIEEAHSLEALNNLQTEVLKLMDNEDLISISHLPNLRELLVTQCPALARVEKLDTLQELEFIDYCGESLPEWLLKLLQNDKNNDFLLHIECTEQVLRECLKGGAYWDIIEKVPRVIAYENFGRGYLRYTKQPLIYETNFK